MPRFIVLIFPLIVSASTFAPSAFAAGTSSSSCYQNLCVGDWVGATSRQGYNLYGEVTGIGRKGTIVVTWISANDWPYYVENVVWPYEQLKKIN